MIYVVLYGRLGNNLWQIAAAATLAKKKSTDFRAYVTPDCFCSEPDNCFLPEYIKQFNETILRNVQFVDSLPQDAKIIEECFLSDIVIDQDEDIILKGYFAKQFDRELVKNLFSIDQVTNNYILRKYPVFLDKSKHICSVTVRRGDYLLYLDEYALCDKSYYLNAMDKMMSLGIINYFLIISDDIDWCKEKFANRDNVTYVDDEKPTIDLYLATLCECNIISNSSFAIWGADLNCHENQIVICPKPWFGYARRAHENDMQSGLPEDWIRINNVSPYYFRGMFIFIRHTLKKKIMSLLKKIKR